MLMIFNRKRSQNPRWELVHRRDSFGVCAFSDLPTTSVRFQFPILWPRLPMCSAPLQHCKVLFICSEHELVMPGRLPAAGPHFAVLATNVPSSCRHNQRGKQRSRSRQGDVRTCGSPTAEEGRDACPILSTSPPPHKHTQRFSPDLGFLPFASEHTYHKASIARILLSIQLPACHWQGPRAGHLLGMVGLTGFRDGLARIVLLYLLSLFI